MEIQFKSLHKKRFSLAYLIYGGLTIGVLGLLLKGLGLLAVLSFILLLLEYFILKKVYTIIVSLNIEENNLYIETYSAIFKAYQTTIYPIPELISLNITHRYFGLSYPCLEIQNSQKINSKYPILELGKLQNIKALVHPYLKENTQFNKTYKQRLFIFLSFYTSLAVFNILLIQVIASFSYPFLKQFPLLNLYLIILASLIQFQLIQEFIIPKIKLSTTYLRRLLNSSLIVCIISQVIWIPKPNNLQTEPSYISTIEDFNKIGNPEASDLIVLKNYDVIFSNHQIKGYDNSLKAKGNRYYKDSNPLNQHNYSHYYIQQLFFNPNTPYYFQSTTKTLNLRLYVEQVFIQKIIGRTQPTKPIASIKKFHSTNAGIALYKLRRKPTHYKIVYSDTIPKYKIPNYLESAGFPTQDKSPLTILEPQWDPVPLYSQEKTNNKYLFYLIPVLFIASASVINARLNS
ncbi:MAG: hypothetical protein EOO99_04110 [Pedobacter sp.]|nr:MAG: hypothetical protein EOO99_04110 [Pedobacter sp.]